GVLEIEQEEGDDQGGEDGERGERGGPAVAGDQAAAAGPGAGGAVVAAGVRPVEPRPDGGEQHGQQRQRDRHRDQRNEHAGVADAAQEGDREREQSEQADGDGAAAEKDGVASGRHRPFDRFEVVGAAGELLAPANDDQQRVVDRDPEPDQRYQVLDDEEDLGEGRD